MIMLAASLHTMSVVGTTTATESTLLIYVLVNSSIYEDIEFYLNRYVSDVEKLGFNVDVFSISEDTAEDIRAILADAYSEGLVGCLLVGDVPWAFYEIDDPEYGHEEFPIDLFYMDLNGVWTDTDSDGKYDQHNGNRVPEIWVGRVKASNMIGNEVALIQNYFDKNHDYRTATLSLPNRALIYIDDDWTGEWSDYVDWAVSLCYNNRTLVDENVTSCPCDYLGRLTQNWSLVHLMVHGESDLHYFMTNGEWVGNVTSIDIQTTDPHAFFYILFSCSNARYVEFDYISGCYVFSDTYGVAAISSTKEGGMLFSDDFYRNFKTENLGFSFREWLAKRVVEEDEDPTWWYDKSWYYGMTILGDPTLSLQVFLQTDLNIDGVVNIVDLSAAAYSFGTREGDEYYNLIADLDYNNEINVIDLSIVAMDYGKTA